MAKASSEIARLRRMMDESTEVDLSELVGAITALAEQMNTMQETLTAIEAQLADARVIRFKR